MSNDRPNAWRVRQAKRWAQNELVQANLWSKSWNQARVLYREGLISVRLWNLYDASWHADGTKLSVQDYQVKYAERFLVREWVDGGHAADLDPGATWEQINAPAGEGLDHRLEL